MAKGLAQALSDLQDKHGLAKLVEVLAENQRDAWDNCACKYDESENIVRFYEKATLHTEKLADKISALEERYPTIAKA